MSAAEKRNNYITLKEAAEYCHCSIRHLQEEITRGNLRAYKPGKLLLFDIEDLNKWVKKKAIK